MFYVLCYFQLTILFAHTFVSPGTVRSSTPLSKEGSLREKFFKHFHVILTSIELMKLVVVFFIVAQIAQVKWSIWTALGV